MQKFVESLCHEFIFKEFDATKGNSEGYRYVIVVETGGCFGAIYNVKSYHTLSIIPDNSIAEIPKMYNPEVSLPFNMQKDILKFCENYEERGLLKVGNWIGHHLTTRDIATSLAVRFSYKINDIENYYSCVVIKRREIMENVNPDPLKGVEIPFILLPMAKIISGYLSFKDLYQLLEAKYNETIIEFEKYVEINKLNTKHESV